MKKVLSAILVLTLLLSLCSCSNPFGGSSSQTPNANAAQNGAQTPDANAAQNQFLPSQTPSSDLNAGSAPAIPVSLNVPFNVGNVMTITLASCEWCEEIRPSNTSGVYSYYKDKDGEKYFVIRGELKNLSGKNLDIEYASDAELIINGRYNAHVNLETEENDGTSFYGNVKPLQTLKLIVYVSVSDELYDICESMELRMKIVNDEEKLGYYYDEDYPQDCFTMTFSK